MNDRPRRYMMGAPELGVPLRTAFDFDLEFTPTPFT